MEAGLWACSNNLDDKSGQEVPDFVCGVVLEGFEALDGIEVVVLCQHLRAGPDEGGFDEQLSLFAKKRFDAYLDRPRLFVSDGMGRYHQAYSAAGDGAGTEVFEIFGGLSQSRLPEILECMLARTVEVVDPCCRADDLVLLGGPDLSKCVGCGHGVPAEHGEIAGWVVGEDLNAADLRCSVID
ncbi:MAG: hypothetical protein V3S33_05355, partial [Gammaproteobacteria bacterium]